MRQTPKKLMHACNQTQSRLVLYQQQRQPNMTTCTSSTQLLWSCIAWPSWLKAWSTTNHARSVSFSSSSFQRLHKCRCYPLFLDKTDCTLFNSNRSLIVLVQSRTSLHCTESNTMFCRFCNSFSCLIYRMIA